MLKRQGKLELLSDILEQTQNFCDNNENKEDLQAITKYMKEVLRPLLTELVREEEQERQPE